MYTQSGTGNITLRLVLDPITLGRGKLETLTVFSGFTLDGFCFAFLFSTMIRVNSTLRRSSIATIMSLMMVTSSP